MIGTEDNPGLIPRLCDTLLTTPFPETDTVTTTVTYVEIFKEKVMDLLSPSTETLRVREHPTTGPYVENAIVAPVASYTDCLNVINAGNTKRHVASTNLNIASSRSHAIFTLIITQSKPLDNEEYYTVISKLHLVDLAGSENSTQAGSTGERLKEGAAINKSLLTLGIHLIHYIFSVAFA